MDSQVFILNEKRNVTLTAYLQDDFLCGTQKILAD